MVWPFARKRQTETKEHPNGAAFMVGGGQGWARRDRKQQYVTEGYQLNVIVFRAVTEIVKAATSIEVELYDTTGAEAVKVDNHAALDLIASPAPLMTWDSWLTEMLVNRMLLGEAACVAANEGAPAELWPLNPLQIDVKPGRGIPSAYVHEVNSRKVIYPVTFPTGESQVMFVKTYNPTDYWRGQSPLMAAALAGDTHNAGMRWNYSLLRNSARPSGLINFTKSPSSEMIARLKEFVSGSNQGPGNAGKIAWTDSEMKWVELSQNARDMDFLNTMQETAKYVASALGVPLPLIDNDASTFNNLEQAKERLYTDTVIPILNELLSALNNWLLPRYGDGLEFRLDLDTIPALEGLRERMFNRAVTAYKEGLLTLQEARDLMGYEPEAEGGTFKPAATGLFDLPPDEAKAIMYGLDKG